MGKHQEPKYVTTKPKTYYYSFTIARFAPYDAGVTFTGWVPPASSANIPPITNAPINLLSYGVSKQVLRRHTLRAPAPPPPLFLEGDGTRFDLIGNAHQHSTAFFKSGWERQRRLGPVPRAGHGLPVQSQSSDQSGLRRNRWVLLVWTGEIRWNRWSFTP
jgi:hypothetical protein